MLLPVNALWIGNRLGRLHAACLTSFVRAGHRVILHGFEEIVDVPKGVETFDASRLMSRSEIIRHKNGSLALASDIYRLRILREGMGIYVDCDVYCLRPFPDEPYLFGWEGNNLVGSAVLNMPADCELLTSMLEAAENPRFIPPWYSRHLRRKLIMKRMLGRRITLSELEWGAIGPELLTYHLRRLGLDNLARPADSFYPLHATQKSLLNDPELSLSDLITSRSLALHLWSSQAIAGVIRSGSVLDDIAVAPAG
ncbi:hypothetical protein [Hoeflea sp.]|uniref:hypothetical protein n=1 Tax=Hoeflea sp. TaxID=1940281 RepID=UPI003B02A581